MRTRTITTASLWAIASLGIATTLAFAQVGGGYNLTWNSLDCGTPAVSAGGSYLLGGTTGQADTGVAVGGGYTLQGGFWHGSLLPTDAPPPGEEPAGALSFRLHGNTPNPFTARTSIAFTTASASDVQLRIYDLTGRLVRTVLEQSLGAGRHQVFWNGDDDAGHPVANGIYFTRLRAGSFEARRKLVVLR